MENSMSNEPFGFVFSGYKIINTCILGEWLSCFYTDCDKYRPVLPECHTLGFVEHREGQIASLLFCQISLVFMESGAINPQKLQMTGDPETVFNTGNSVDS